MRRFPLALRPSSVLATLVGVLSLLVSAPKAFAQG